MTSKEAMKRLDYIQAEHERKAAGILAELRLASARSKKALTELELESERRINETLAQYANASDQ